MSIKFVKENQSKGVRIPSAALKICGLQDEQKLELHAQEKALVLLPGRMTAMELLRTVEHLNELGRNCARTFWKSAASARNAAKRYAHSRRKWMISRYRQNCWTQQASLPMPICGPARIWMQNPFISWKRRRLTCTRFIPICLKS